MKRFTNGSLFDGSGGFPLTASMCGGVPVWASEIEPYPIAVTKSRLPQMMHLGDISKINGAEIEPVDVITFGSPCQDMSVAGKRAGLKHEDIGDDETTRSGLFMEAVRVAIEMRRATNGKYPKFMLWENVPGAFSSNKGEDFRIVLEELIKIVEPYAVMPSVPSGGWAYADCYVGDRWSLAYRVFDAQYWGVPQRRRRIHLIFDLTGQRAGEILFEREGMRGYFETSRTPWQGSASDVERDAGAADYPGECLTPWDYQSRRVFSANGVMATLPSGELSGQNQQSVLVPVCECRTPEGYCKAPDKTLPFLPYCVPSSSVCYDARGYGDGKIAPTITGDHNNRVTDYTAVVAEQIYCLQGNGIDRTDTTGCNSKGVKEDVSYTLNTIDRPAVAYTMGDLGNRKCCSDASGLKARDYKDATDLVAEGRQYIVRRLTPTECARLQGFPDDWGYPDCKETFSNDEYVFWMGVRNTHAAINGKQEKQYTREQMVKWYNGLHTDSAEYKMWGNGIALPPALYCMQGIAEALNNEG